MEKSRRFGSGYVCAQRLSISSYSFGPTSVLFKRLKLTEAEDYLKSEAEAQTLRLSLN